MSSGLAAYESLLVSNASTIHSIESFVRSLTWFLPGRFKDAELASEALSAVLNLLSLYHDTLLARRIKQNPHLQSKLQPIIPPSVHSRYTRAWADKDIKYKWAARLLEIIKFSQLVIEMGLRKKAGKQGVWRAVVTLETIKTFLRLFILSLTRRPSLSPPIPERDIDPAALSELDTLESASQLKQQNSSKSGDGLPSPPHTPAHLKNNRAHLPPVRDASRTVSPLLSAIESSNSGSSNGVPPPLGPSNQAIEAFLLPKALTTADVRPSLLLMRPLTTPKDWLSEVLYILRPLIYVLAISKTYDPNPARRSSLPFLLSLSVDILSYHLRRQPMAGLASTSLERQEYARRDRDLLWYFLRGDIWEGWTKPKLESIASSTSSSRIPLLGSAFGLAGAFIKDWIPLIDDYYYYTST